MHKHPKTHTSFTCNDCCSEINGSLLSTHTSLSSLSASLIALYCCLYLLRFSDLHFTVLPVLYVIPSSQNLRLLRSVLLVIAVLAPDRYRLEISICWC
ncbi:hypothetical protein L2E82_13407 [Cichorium intybus]|uniref:Uncharacterized protein n=1 Tax=Cichorium intybus TaxID=13427 RepID=A0ACB9EY45_CICIN|nr:hypothetical protein L2E82_13407 [Cichorium intybus]